MIQSMSLAYDILRVCNLPFFYCLQICQKKKMKKTYIKSGKYTRNIASIYHNKKGMFEENAYNVRHHIVY